MRELLAHATIGIDPSIHHSLIDQRPPPTTPLKLNGKHGDSKIARPPTAPGLAIWRLTTKEPDDDMIEIAIKAVEEASRLSDA